MSAQLQQAIINAHNAGDVEAAKRLGQLLKTQSQGTAQAPHRQANPQQQAASVRIPPHRRNQPKPSAAKDGAFEGYGDAFMRGIDQPLENMGVTAEALGAEGLGKSLKGAIDERPGQSASAQFMNADKDGSFAWRYLPKAGVEQAGQFAGSIASRAGGAALGGAVGNVPGAIAGGFAGPALFEFVQQLGPIALERAKNNGRDKPNAEDWTYATGTSVGVGAMNAIAPGASGTAKRMLIEGATEGGQSVVEQVGSTALTKKGLEVDPRQAAAEGIIGGTSAGMVDTSVSTAKAAANLVRGTNRNSKAKLEDVSEEEMQAKASFAQTLAAIAEEENLDLTNIDRTSTKGARQAIDLAHKRLVGDLKARIKDLKPRLAVTDQDTLSELEDKIFANLAQDEARTKVKNKVGSREKEAFIKLAGDTYEGQLSLNLMLQLDELTAIHSEGYKGGVSRVTDQLAPLGLGGEGYDVSRANAEQVFRPVLSVAAASQTGGLSLIPQAAIWGGGRLIDKARGGRSRVKAYVDKNQNNPGQTLPDESTSLRNQNIETQQAEAAEAEAARLRQEQLAQESREASLDLARENAPPNPESPQGIFELATALDRSGIAQVLRVIKRTADSEVSRWIQAYETSVATGGKVDYRLVRKINSFVDSNPVYKGLMGNRVRNQGVVQQAAQQQLSQKEQNYQRGIEDNRAEAARITEAINADGTISVIHKALLLNTLEKMQLNLGKNPVATLQKMALRLEEKGVPGETVEKYLGQYLQRVMAQQGAKEELAVAKDAAMEIENFAVEAKKSAKKEGFDTSKVYYHGGPDIGQENRFTANYMGDRSTSVGNFLTDDPTIADEYVPVDTRFENAAGGYDYKPGSGILQVYTKGNIFDLSSISAEDLLGSEQVGKLHKIISDEFPELSQDDLAYEIGGGRLWDHNSSFDLQNAVLRAVSQLGYDGVDLPDETFGRLNTSRVIFEPSNIRPVNETSTLRL